MGHHPPGADRDSLDGPDFDADRHRDRVRDARTDRHAITDADCHAGADEHA